jgi:hypothetical protein
VAEQPLLTQPLQAAFRLAPAAAPAAHPSIMKLLEHQSKTV